MLRPNPEFCPHQSMLAYLGPQVILALLSVICGTNAAGSEPEKSNYSKQQIAQLIHQLGDEKFQVRGAAAAALTKAGPAAFDAIDKAKKSDNREVRTRAAAIEKEIIDAAVTHLKELGVTFTINDRSEPIWLTATNNKKITDDDLRHASCLRSLEKLFLENTDVSDVGMFHIRSLPNVTKISLTQTKITDAGMVYLLELPKLDSVALSGCDISDSGVSTLSRHPEISGLGLAKTCITDASLAHLARLKKLVGVTLDSTKITGDGLADLAPLAKQLRNLQLWNLPLADDDLRPLKELVGLVVLHLNGTEITDAGLIHIKELPRLKLLYLFQTGITDEAVSHLKEFTALERLELGGTKVTPEGLVGLREAPKLIAVKVPTSFTDEDIVELQDKLTFKSNRRRISVKRSGFSLTTKGEKN